MTDLAPPLIQYLIFWVKGGGGTVIGNTIVGISGLSGVPEGAEEAR